MMFSAFIGGRASRPCTPVQKEGDISDHHNSVSDLFLLASLNGKAQGASRLSFPEMRESPTVTSEPVSRIRIKVGQSYDSLIQRFNADDERAQNSYG